MNRDALSKLAALAPEDGQAERILADVQRILEFVASVQAAAGSNDVLRPDAHLADDVPARPVPAATAIATAPELRDGFVALPALFQEAT